MKDLGPRTMSQDQRPRTQRSGFKIQNQNRSQLPRLKNKDEESMPKPKEPRFKDEGLWVKDESNERRIKNQKSMSRNQRTETRYYDSKT